MSIKDYESVVQREIKRVRDFKTTSKISPWVVESKPAECDSIHEEKDVSLLKHVRKITIEKLNSHDMHTVI